MFDNVPKTLSFFKRLPGGLWIFSRLLGWLIPYAGTIRADIIEMAEGGAMVNMQDRRAVRNHLNSVHAMALGNLGELTANLALASLCPAQGRFIVTRVEAEYLKKARGPLTCTCHLPADLPWQSVKETAATAVISNEKEEPVTRVTVYWKLELKPLDA